MDKLPHLSLCMIARDSARTLDACLQSIRPWVDEIVVVDTGSLDDTPSIARRYGARVFDFTWCDDFAAARNESLRHARGEWLFWMDSDDTIDEENGRKLRALANSTHPATILGFVMQVHCPGPCTQGDRDFTAVDHVKMFRNLPTLRFAFRIHEQILPAIRDLGGEVAWTDIHVVHSGSDQSPSGRQRKHERDLRILQLELKERPDHPFTLFNLGMTYADMGAFDVATQYLKHSIAVAATTDSHLRKAYALLVNSLAQLTCLDEAHAICETALSFFPDDPELRFRLALIAQQRGHFAIAERAYLKLLKQQTDRYFSSIDPGILGYKARQNLATVYTAMDRQELAELQWRHVIDEMPEYQVGWRGLIESQLAVGRNHSALLEIDHMLGITSLRCTALLGRARIAIAQGQLESARNDIEAAVEESPSEIEPLEVLCRFLFEHGDSQEAALALQDLAKRSPEDGAIFHNLGAINARLGHYSIAAAAYRESLRLRPQSDHTRRELADVLSRQPDLVAAGDDGFR